MNTFLCLSVFVVSKIIKIKECLVGHNTRTAHLYSWLIREKEKTFIKSPKIFEKIVRNFNNCVTNVSDLQS